MLQQRFRAMGTEIVTVADGAHGLDAVRRRLSLKDPRASLAIDSSPAGTRATVAWPVDAVVS